MSVQADAVVSGSIKITIQEHIGCTNPGRLQAFDQRIAKVFRTLKADVVAESMELQAQVQRQCYEESVGLSHTYMFTTPPSVAQQLHTAQTEQARSFRKQCIAKKAVSHPLPALAPRKRGGAGTPSKCSACGLIRKESGHNRSGCPTHCLKCRQPKSTCQCTE